MNHKQKEFSHIRPDGQPGQVDISEKTITYRTAHARSFIKINDEIAKLYQQNDLISSKGAVFQTAIIAGTMASKQTASLIPFCHPLNLESCKIEITMASNLLVQIDCYVGLHGKTGVEMEALTGASIAALTVYDMCKSVSHEMIIEQTFLIEKTGGKSDLNYVQLEK